MKKKFLIFLVSICLGISSFWVGYSLGKDRDRDTFYKELDIFAEGLAYIDKKYVDKKAPQDLIYGAMKGLLTALDPYSQFLTPDEYKELLVETEGEFGGVGIEITLREGLLTVVSPIDGTPAYRAGVKAGDIIVKINGEITKGITLEGAVKKLRGKPGTKVKITVLREEERQLQDIEITRDIIKIKDIRRAQILDDGIGYLKISEFRSNTAQELDKSLSKLKGKGLKGLIIDVRNNPGGLLESAIQVASRFLEDGKKIVSIKSRDRKEEVFKSLSLKDKFTDIPLVLLINKGSASASEIVAAALRDNKRAVLLGETSFGKGSVQTVIPLSDGSALRLTTAKYYTPRGASIHNKGITPDISAEEKVLEKEKKEEEVFNQLKGNGFDYKKDYQLLRAVDLIKGMLVLAQNE